MKDRKVFTEDDELDMHRLREDNIKFFKDYDEIGENVFDSHLSLTEIEIPSNIKVIGKEAFIGCENLRELVLNEGLEEIGENAFEDCTSLKTLEIPSSVKKIGDMAFYNCESLEEVIIDDGITELQSKTFYGCDSLEGIKLPNSLTVLHPYTFYNFNVLETVIMPNNIKSIGSHCFYSCSCLEEIEIPSSVEKIELETFAKCETLKKVKLYNGLKSIESDAFRECFSLEEIEIPKTVEVIGKNAFARCTNLKKVKLYDGLKEIREFAFFGCNKIEEIEIPSSVKKIGEFAFNDLKYICVLESGNVLLSSELSRDDIKSYVSIEEIRSVYQDIQLSEFLISEERTKQLIDFTKDNIKKGIRYDGIFFYDYETFIKIGNRNPKVMNTLMNYAGYNKKGVINHLYPLAYNIGLFEDRSVTVKVEGKDIPVSDVAYTVLQNIFKRGDLKVSEINSLFGTMKLKEYNEQFLKFVADKNNFNELKQEEYVQEGFTSKVYEWFEKRKNLVIDGEERETLPIEESNRYKIKTYETADLGIDKIKWKKPTVELLKKEFSNKKFTGVNEDNEHIARYLEGFHLYGQKHFDKAVEIDKERKESGVKDHIISTAIKEDLISSLEEYQKRTNKLRDEIVNVGSEVAKDQTDTMSKIFTYEMLAKSDVANFAIGFLTSCCATLYGAGAGAQRAMIIHPDMQPLVIRDSKDNIVALGIIYVNRKEGYAVINDFEVNKKYKDDEEAKEAIYNKVIQGIDAFVTQYNKENNVPINIVTSGLSPNWEVINEYIKKNPKSSLLSAPNFDEFKYSGSGSWNGDWHKEQYVIWENKGEKRTK